MAVWFGRWLVIVKVASSEASVLGTAPAVTVITGHPPPSNSSARESSVSWVIGTSLDGNGG
jgi:hypothetical protein